MLEILVPLGEGGSFCITVSRAGTVKAKLDAEGEGGRDVAEAEVPRSQLDAVARSFRRIAAHLERIRPEGCAVEQGKAARGCAQRRCPCALELHGI